MFKEPKLQTIDYDTTRSTSHEIYSPGLQFFISKFGKYYYSKQSHVS